jgi:AP-1 complex subunit beta-1
MLLSPHQVVLRMMEEVRNEDLIKVWTKKMAPPLVTLLSAEPEVQYVALRNINLIVQRWPQILAHEVKVSAGSSGIGNRASTELPLYVQQ